MQGKFITFEGGEGCGKTTQIKMLSNFLKEKGVDNITTKEPGGTELGADLRRLLVTGAQNKMDAMTEALLFYADRHHHLVNKIYPAIKENKWVISDRFADSTVAYQYYGYNKRLSKAMLDQLYQIAVGDFKPDLTIILDIIPEKGLQRSLSRAQNEVVKEIRFEQVDISFHQRLRDGYLQIAQNEPKRCVVLDADKSIEELHFDIVNTISERFKLK